MTGAERTDGDVSTESARNVVRERFDWSSVSPSEAVVEAVVSFSGLGHDEIEPLYDTVDPDAMDVLVADSAVDASVSLTLTLEGHEIYVRSDGTVVVSEAEE